MLKPKYLDVYYIPRCCFLKLRHETTWRNAKINSERIIVKVATHRVVSGTWLSFRFPELRWVVHRRTSLKLKGSSPPRPCFSLRHFVATPPPTPPTPPPHPPHPPYTHSEIANSHAYSQTLGKHIRSSRNYGRGRGERGDRGGGRRV